MRSSLAALSSEELARRREELAAEAGAERHNQETARQLEERIAEFRALPDRGGRDQLVARLRSEREALPPVEHQARAEMAVIDHLLAERERAALAAARVSPPDYITAELGERPDDPVKRQSWDRAVLGIEGYRQRHGIGDRDSALGAEPGDRTARLAREQARDSIRRAQRSLGLEQAPVSERAVEMEIEL